MKHKHTKKTQISSVNQYLVGLFFVLTSLSVMALSLLVLEDNQDIRQQAYVDEPDPTPTSIVINPSTRPTSILTSPTTRPTSIVTSPTKKPTNTPSTNRATGIPTATQVVRNTQPTRRPTATLTADESRVVRYGILDTTGCVNNDSCKNGDVCIKESGKNTGICQYKGDSPTRACTINSQCINGDVCTIGSGSNMGRCESKRTPTSTVAVSQFRAAAPTLIVPNGESTNTTVNRPTAPTKVPVVTTSRLTTTDTGTQNRNSQTTNDRSATKTNQGITGKITDSVSRTQSNIDDVKTANRLFESESGTHTSTNSLTKTVATFLTAVTANRSDSTTDQKANTKITTTETHRKTGSDDDAKNKVIEAAGVNQAFLKQSDSDSTRSVNSTFTKNPNQLNILVSDKGEHKVHTVTVPKNPDNTINQVQLTANIQDSITNNRGTGLDSEVVKRQLEANTKGHEGDVTVATLKAQDTGLCVLRIGNCLANKASNEVLEKNVNAINAVDLHISTDDTPALNQNAQHISLNIGRDTVEISQDLNPKDITRSNQEAAFIGRLSTSLPVVNQSAKATPVNVTLKHNAAQNTGTSSLSSTLSVLNRFLGGTSPTNVEIVRPEGSTHAYIPAPSASVPLSKTAEVGAAELQLATNNQCGMKCWQDEYKASNRVERFMMDIAIPGLQNSRNDEISAINVKAIPVDEVTEDLKASSHTYQSSDDKSAIIIFYDKDKQYIQLPGTVDLSSPNAKIINTLQQQVANNPEAFAESLNTQAQEILDSIPQ